MKTQACPVLSFSSIKALKTFADFGASEVEEVSDEIPVSLLPVPIGVPPVEDGRKLGLNLAYTINLNLPATADIAVFNAIFKSLKENLLKDTYAR